MPLHRRYHHGPFIFQWPNTFCILSNATQTNLFLFVQCVWRSMSCFCSRDLSYHKSNLRLIIVLFFNFLLIWAVWFLKYELHRWKYELSLFYVHYDPFFFINSNAPQIIFSYLFSASDNRRAYFLVGIILINESNSFFKSCYLSNIFRLEQTGFSLRVTHT